MAQAGAASEPMVVVQLQPQAKEATMFTASLGGRDAARSSLYRHALVRAVTPLLPALACGGGWSGLALALAAILMSWDPAPTLGQRFESALAVLDAALPRRRRTGRTYQGWVKALAAHGGAVLRALVPHLRTLTEHAAGKHWRVGGEGGFVPLGADGSKVDAPRTIANEALGFAGKDKCGPQIMTLLLVHLGVMLPWAWKAAGVRTGERTLLRDLLHLLPERTLLVADAGFTGFDLLSALRCRGHSFLVRVGSGVHLLRELGYYRREGKSTVYLWPDARRDHEPLVLRLIRVGSAYLITDVTDPRRLSAAAAGELYRRRWGLEVAFRSLKQTLERRAVRSGAAAHALAELDWAVAGLWILSLLGVRSIAAAGHAPRRLSLAATLAAVRAARLRPFTDHALRGRLRRAVQDGYRRHASKRSYRWPRKKDPPTIRPPVVTTATAAQVQQARQFRSSRTAA
jgi:hypothetical protein